MIQDYTIGKQNWRRINQATEDEINQTVAKFNIDPFITKELALPNPKSKIEFYKDAIYLIMHFPAFRHSHKNTKQEIDFIIKKDSLITIQYENIDALHKFAKEMEVKEILSKQNENRDIFITLLKELYYSLNDEVMHIESWANSITKHIFSGKEKEMVLEISEAIRALLEFEKITEPHREIFEFLMAGGEKMFGINFKYDIENIQNEYTRLKKLINNNLVILRELRETNNSILNTKQNEIMKTLTVITFIYLPINLIIAIFTMHANGTPFWNHPNVFYIIMTMCFITLLVMIQIAKKKKWL